MLTVNRSASVFCLIIVRSRILLMRHCKQQKNSGILQISPFWYCKSWNTEFPATTLVSSPNIITEVIDVIPIIRPGIILTYHRLILILHKERSWMFLIDLFNLTCLCFVVPSTEILKFVIYHEILLLLLQVVCLIFHNTVVCSRNGQNKKSRPSRTT
jgi:hypothetical protein